MFLLGFVDRILEGGRWIALFNGTSLKRREKEGKEKGGVALSDLKVEKVFTFFLVCHAAVEETTDSPAINPGGVVFSERGWNFSRIFYCSTRGGSKGNFFEGKNWEMADFSKTRGRKQRKHFLSTLRRGEEINSEKGGGGINRVFLPQKRRTRGRRKSTK